MSNHSYSMVMGLLCEAERMKSFHSYAKGVFLETMEAAHGGWMVSAWWNNEAIYSL